MSLKIAVPIIAKTMNAALRDIAIAAKVADIIELRIDYMQRPVLTKLLEAQSQIPKIVTNRTHLEGGNFTGDESRRVAYLQEAIDLGVEYVDIENDHYFELDRGDTQIIISKHNFTHTPPLLLPLYTEIADKNPDIIKIATMANSYDDVIRMMNLVSEAQQPIIGLCMGPIGVPTRVLGPSVGSYLTFASLDKSKSSASGQLTVAEVRKAYELLQLE